MATDVMREASSFRPELLAHCYRTLGSVYARLFATSGLPADGMP